MKKYRSNIRTKKCKKCGQIKSLNDFHHNRTTNDGYKAFCKPCTLEYNRQHRSKNWRQLIKNYQHKYRLKKKFRMTPEQYNVMFDNQNGKCAICKKFEARIAGGEITRLTVDHNHKTGIVRELLCLKCNAGLGHFNHDIEHLKQAIKYLRKHTK